MTATRDIFGYAKGGLVAQLAQPGLQTADVAQPPNARPACLGCATGEPMRNREIVDFPKEMGTFPAPVTGYANFTCARAHAHARVRTCARVHARETKCVTDEKPSLDFEALAKALRVPSIRDHQRRAIEAASRGQDVLAICPTGSGKTASFLGAGLVRRGLVLVISPLRSLIADQYRRLTDLGLPVRVWNSDIPDADKTESIDLLNAGWSGFFYTTPESLKGRELATALKGRVDLAVIDEAHCCLRERGFRIHYAWLGATLDRIGPAVRFACTATLPAHDRAALVRSLRLHEPHLIVLPVARENLRIHVVQRDPAVLTWIIDEHPRQSGIIFAATIRTAEKLYCQLRDRGRNVGLYHGQLAARKKKEYQNSFMSGQVPVMVATDAFLLGIDKSDIRFVAHYDPPKSIEDWTQGFGRAGRDDLPADVYGCFYGDTQGWDSREFLLKASYPPVEEIGRLWRYLVCAPWHDRTQADLAVAACGPKAKHAAGSMFNVLRRHHLVEELPHPEDRRRKLYRACGDFDGVDWSRYWEEATDAFRRFEMLCSLARLPEEEIPHRIDQYFAVENFLEDCGDDQVPF